MKQIKSYGLVTGAEHYMLIQAEHHFEKIHRKKTNKSERKRPSNRGLTSKNK